jgi:hypothetical protein
MSFRHPECKLRRVGWWLVVLLLLGLLFLLGNLKKIPGLARYGIGPPVTLTHIREVTQITGLHFPREAVLLDGEFLGGMSPYLIARIRIAHAEVARFLAQSPIHGRANNTGSYLQETNVPFMERRGWNPRRVRRFLAVDGLPMPQSYGTAGAWILIDLDDPRAAILYLYYQD